MLSEFFSLIIEEITFLRTVVTCLRVARQYYIYFVIIIGITNLNGAVG